MPYVYKNTKRKRRSRRKRRKSYRAGFGRISGPGLTPTFPLARTFKNTFRYSSQGHTINPGVGGTPATHVFSLNGMFDPDVTGGGNQPLGYDQFMLMYNHYTVIGSRAIVTCYNSEVITPQMIILHIKDTATLSTDMEQVVENGNCRYDLLPAAAHKPHDLTINCSPSHFFGKNVLLEDAFRGGVTSNPNEQVYLHVTGFPLNSTDTQPIYFNVLIEYIAILQEPKELARST